jgi:plastocyanin
MMKVNGLMTRLSIILGIFCFAVITLAAEEKNEEIKVINKIITVDYNGLTPKTITSTPGTAVIWVNHSRFPIEILFVEKKVVLACASPVNFFVGKDGVYESNKIPSGGTASLCFIEKGTYEYKVKHSTTFYTGRIQRGHQGSIEIQ